jgi:hypothetical protein
MMDELNENKPESTIEKREEKTFDIQLHHNGTGYKGWVIPSDKKNESGSPKSYHVVLNDVFFGNLTLHNNAWEADTQRERSLVQAVGKQIAETGH